VTREYDIYGKYSTATYNALGQQASFKDPAANDTGSSAVTIYMYDGLGRLTSESDTTGFSLAYSYDTNGNRASMAYANGSGINYGKVTFYFYDTSKTYFYEYES